MFNYITELKLRKAVLRLGKAGTRMLTTTKWRKT